MIPLLKLLLRQKAYLILSLACLLSGVGTAFSTVAVFGELGRQNASPMYYTAAFLAALFPGFITSFIAGRYSNKLNIATLTILAEIIGAISLAGPLLGLLFGNLWFLLFAELVGSAISGFLAPFHQSYIRRIFKDDEIALVCAYDVYVFTANFILGQVVGTVIYSFIGTRNFFIIDLVTYICAAGMIAWAKYLDGASFLPIEAAGEPAGKFRWAALSPIQKRVFMIMPLLSLICAPSMSLLPARGAAFGAQLYIGSLVLSPVLLFLLLKALGQLLGPQVAARCNLDRMLNNSGSIVVFLAAYLGFYWLVFTSQHLWLVVVCIVCAHIFSNIVYMLGFYGFTRHFNEYEMGAASAKNYQANLLAIFFASIVASIMAEHFTLKATLLFALLPLIFAAWVFKGASQEVENAV